MIAKVKMPKLTENEEEQTVTAWFKREGDLVRKGEPLAEITTSKAAFELEAPRSGVLRQILAGVQSNLPVGYIIALIGEAREALPDVAAANRKLVEQQRQKVGSVPAAKARAAAAGGGGLRATPAARRLARERGVDLARVQEKLRVEVITESVLAKYLAQETP